ncbi:hypothetical protein [Streptomyces sp. 6N223]
MARSQLTYRAEASERDDITMRAITFAAGGMATRAGAFSHLG